MQEFFKWKREEWPSDKVRRGDTCQFNNKRNDARRSTSLGDKIGWRECQKRMKGKWVWNNYVYISSHWQVVHLYKLQMSEYGKINNGINLINLQ